MSRVLYVLVCAVALVMASAPANTNMLATARGEGHSSLPAVADFSATAGSLIELSPSATRFFAIETLHWDGPYSDNAVGLTQGGTFYTAVRLTPDKNVTLTNVIWVSHDPPTQAVVFIWGPGSDNTPGAVLDSVVSTTGTKQWVNVEVPNRELPTGSDFWVGVRVTHAAGQFPVGVDAGPAVPLRGGFINFQGSWTELRTVGLNFNWNIRAIVTTGPAPGADVGVSAILAPTGTITPGNVTPRATIRNFGSQPQSNIPVHIVVDEGGSPVYTAELTHPGPVAPGGTANVNFTPDWNATEGTYGVTCWTALTGDENPSNDTARGTVRVVDVVREWVPIPAPTASPDRIVHATIYDPDTDQIFQVGGNPAGATNTYDGITRAFDPVTNSWASKAPMPTPLGWCGYGLVRGKIYIISGHNNAGSFVGQNQEYDIAGNRWSAKTARPGTPVAAPLSVTWRDSLVYVMGGLATAAVNRVDIYRPADNGWLVGTALPRPAFMGSAEIIGDTIYIAQAYDGAACWPNLWKGVINPDDPTDIEWIQGPALSEPVFNGPTVVAGDEVYWMGGFINATTPTNKVWKYSPVTGQITPETPLYPINNTRCTFAATRNAGTGELEIYGMAGDRDGDWNPPNQTYVRLTLRGSDVADRPEPLRAVIESVRPSVVRDRAVVSYSLSRAGHVNLGVYDAAGKLVRTLVNGQVLPGAQSATWNRTDDSGRRVSNGTYFYRLTVDGSAFSAKSVVLN